MSSFNQQLNKNEIGSNILFYMESCKTCMFFINIAQQNNILKHFKLICIDGNKEKFIAQGLKKVPTIIVKNINKQIEGNDCIKWLDSIIKMRSTNTFDNQNEMYVPDIGLINSGNSNNSGIRLNNSNSGLINSRNVPLQNAQINQIKPINNEFQVPTTNVRKRGELSITNPPITNSKNKQNINNQNESNKEIQKEPQVKQVNQLFGFLDNEMSGFSDSYAYLMVDNPLPKSFLPPDKDLQIYTAPEGDKIDKKKQDVIYKNLELQRNNDKTEFIQKINETTSNILNNNTPKWYDKTISN